MKKNSLNFKVFCFVIVLIVISFLIVFVLENNKVASNGKLVSRVSQYNVRKNEDDSIVGWIKISGTNIDYPVYLGNGFNKSYSSDIIWTNDTLSNGEKRKTILGHNLINLSNKPLVNSKRLSRFEDLMGYVYEDFTKEHLYVQYLDIDSEESLYKIYAVSFFESEDDNGESYKKKNDIENYIKTVKANSIYDFGIDVDYTDELITLSTCTRYFGLEGPTHFKVDARKVRKNEKINNYSVKKNSNYDIINEE